MPQELKTRNLNPQTENIKPRLLLHACCAPCATYVLEHLVERFQVDIYYYNPSIEPYAEYEKRFAEFAKLLADSEYKGKVELIKGEYENDTYRELICGLEEAREGGERCLLCFEQRLAATAERASADGYDYYTTTLTVSPYKNAAAINKVGETIVSESCYLVSDFKKKDGYKRSLELSRSYGLYRQDYCGCIFSKKSKNN